MYVVALHPKCTLTRFKFLSFQYQEAVDAIGKTLHLFARKQQ